MNWHATTSQASTANTWCSRPTLAKGFPTFTPVKPVDRTAASGPRVWTDSTGKYKVEATYVGVQGENIRLRRSDGREIVVPVKSLSPADQDVIAVLAAASALGTTPRNGEQHGEITGGKIPNGWAKFVASDGTSQLATPGELEKNDTSATPLYQYQRVGGPMFAVEIRRVEDASAGEDAILRDSARSAVRLYEGKMLREERFPGAGVAAMRFHYQVKLADEQVMFHVCTFLLGRTVIDLSVSDSPDDFTAEVAAAADQFFKSFKPLR